MLLWRRLAGRDRPRHQPRPGDHPPLLLGGRRPRRRRPGGHRRVRAVGARPSTCARVGAGRGPGGHGGVVLRAARTGPRVDAVAARRSCSSPASGAPLLLALAAAAAGDGPRWRWRRSGHRRRAGRARRPTPSTPPPPPHSGAIPSAGPASVGSGARRRSRWRRAASGGPPVRRGRDLAGAGFRRGQAAPAAVPGRARGACRRRAAPERRRHGRRSAGPRARGHGRPVRRGAARHGAAGAGRGPAAAGGSCRSAPRAASW